ncbi:hypothetical protein VNO78_21892 [Psophocarpus tetragonolobus]|uniref:Uncharacterized protein n=1 Tax=Psophocarpus tetragonolobus TaxID=3891 RepID=A0AAN9XIG3_PSOTE
MAQYNNGRREMQRIGNDIDKDIYTFPIHFYNNFKDELPATIWLIDSANTRIGVFLRKYQYSGYFEKGLINVLKFYKLANGAWIYLKYEGESCFKLRVFDLHFKEVTYPESPKIFEFGDSADLDGSWGQRKVIVPWPFYESFKDELPIRCKFVDHVGSEIGILVHKFDNGADFVQGILNVLKHYQLKNGAWVFLYYEGNGKFKIRVKDLHFKKIKYPQTAIIYNLMGNFSSH